jgi:aspartate 1-decarboxylase
MLREMMKSKIHRATITDANLDYVGSLTLDPLLMEAADLLPGEKVHVVNVNTGGRFETYVIEGGRGTGIVCANGAAARLVQRGDLVIVIAYGFLDDAEARDRRPRVAFVDARNRLVPPGRAASSARRRGRSGADGC